MELVPTKHSVPPATSSLSTARTFDSNQRGPPNTGSPPKEIAEESKDDTDDGHQGANSKENTQGREHPQPSPSDDSYELEGDENDGSRDDCNVCNDGEDFVGAHDIYST